jgi:GTPase SAR1 family protein
MSDSISFSSNRNSIQKFKIVLVGDQNVGKSSIIARYIRNEFDPTKNVLVEALSPPSESTSSVKTSQRAAK